MTSTSYSLPWLNANQEDSAFHEEPEYANSSSNQNSYANSSSNQNSYESYHNGNNSDNCPDYEEVQGLLLQNNNNKQNNHNKELKEYTVYNLASEGVFQCNKNKMEENLTKEKIMTSLVYCIHKEVGCNWNGPLNKLKGHLNTCKKDAIPCQNLCGAKIARLMMEDHMLYTCKKRLVVCTFCKKDFTGAVIEDHQNSCGFEPVHCENKCGLQIQRNRLKAHQVNTCSKRLVACQYCAKNFTADTMQSHHRLCSLFPVPCPNRCSSESLAREDVEKHLEEDCEHKKLQLCAYRDAGCQFSTSSSSGMEQHIVESTRLHLDFMCNLVHKQQAHINKLTGQLERAHTSYNGVLMWKIKDFAAKMEEAKSSEGLELVSMPFFTSQCGYKLQASLFLNGNGAGEDNHISVYIKILPGEFDSILKWPFRHTVSFSLLDQNEDRQSACNVVESFIPDPSWPNFQRPSRHPDQLGFGFPKFVPHEIIQSRQYVKDGSLFIKIRVDPSRNVAV